MWFGESKTQDCINCVLAHSLHVGTRKISKGTVLTESLVNELLENDYSTLTVARLESDDVDENLAATRLAKSLCGEGVRIEAAHTGRVNLYASVDGLFEFQTESIIAANSVSEGITLSVIPQNQWVLAGRMIGTAKIIPYAVPAPDLEKVIECASELIVHKPSCKNAILIQTTHASIKQTTLDKTALITRQRLQTRSCLLNGEIRCNHDISSVADALQAAVAESVDLILIVGASAISDRRDVLPAAVTQCKGEVRRVGLPVDPGNLLMLASIGSTLVLGLPGCARSPKYNGLDYLLDRIACDVAITDQWLNSLCIGGLLGEIHDRPRPRVATKSTNTIAALILAAGSSRRAGDINKLLYSYNGKALVCSVVESVLDSTVTESLLVTGHQQQLVESEIAELPIKVRHCSNYANGMAHSLATGISQLQSNDAVLVCLADMPHVSPEVIDQILASAGRDVADKIFVPVYKEQRGNPVLIGRAFFDSLLKNEGDSGARYLIKQYPQCVVEVKVDSESILQDYDTLHALQQLDES